jgi:hypothetical protein
VIGTVGVMLKLESTLTVLYNLRDPEGTEAGLILNTPNRVHREVDLRQLRAKLDSRCIRLRGGGNRDEAEQQRAPHAVNSRLNLVHPSNRGSE